MKWKILATIALSIALCGAGFTEGRALSFITNAASAQYADGPVRVKQVIYTPTATGAYFELQDSLTDVVASKVFDITTATAIETLTFSFGDDEDFLPCYTGLYGVISNATVTIVLMGDGLTTVTNGGSTTATKRDPVTGVLYSIIASGSATVRDAFAFWWVTQDSDLTIADN